MMYDKAKEAMGRRELEQVQLERLQMTLNRVYRNVAFYKSVFDAQHVSIESIRSLEDLPRLPFTTRENLAGAYPYDMFAVPLREIVRVLSDGVLPRGHTTRTATASWTAPHDWSEKSALGRMSRAAYHVRYRGQTGGGRVYQE